LRHGKDKPVTETQNASITPEAPQDAGSFFGNLFNLYFEPGETFAKIFVKHRVWLAILLQTALGVLFSTIWLQKVDTREFMRAQMAQNPRIQQMPAEQVDRIIAAQGNAMKTWGRIAPFIAPVIIDLIAAGFFLFIFRFFLAADVSFVQCLATIAWSFAAIGLVQTPIMLTVLYLKGDWNVDPNQVVQANPTVFFELGDLPRWLWSLLSSFDLFSLWTVFLLATGFSVAGKRGLATGLWGVGIPWALFVMVKVGFTLLFR
jgi:hypothetical protein